jgi:hypothetical protein
MLRTLFLSRLLGLFFLTLVLAGLTQGSTLAATATTIGNAPALLLISGMLTLLAGLAIVLLHNLWRDGATALVVTIVGWALLIKGAALVVLPPASWFGIVRASGFSSHYALYGIPTLALGIYLTFAGFRAPSARNLQKT